MITICTNSILIFVQHLLISLALAHLSCQRCNYGAVLICQAEVEVTILKFLESCVVTEGEDVHFKCLVSHEEAPLAQWKLQDVPLQNNEMNLIETEGRSHSLTLRGVTTADSGTVSFSVGNHTSTASLTVRGKGNISLVT